MFACAKIKIYIEAHHSKGDVSAKSEYRSDIATVAPFFKSMTAKKHAVSIEIECACVSSHYLSRSIVLTVNISLSLELR